MIHERLAAEPYGFTGHYQRVKEHVRGRRSEILEHGDDDADDAHRGFHARLTTTAGAQAQVDWREEGTITTPTGDVTVYSFHMVLSYLRDPFCRYTTSTDLATFWACHREAFAHFGGVPASIVYDRTKTVVRRHVGRDEVTPLHPEAVAFADHYGFAIRRCAPYRPQSKGHVERVVEVTRGHVLAGRTISSVAEMEAAWEAELPIKCGQVHRTHGEVIAVRGDRDRAALLPVPPAAYIVCERHIRTVGTDARVHFDASVYSVPWRLVRPRQKVELRVDRDSVVVWTLGADADSSASTTVRCGKGSWLVNPEHWDGLPGHTLPHAGPTTAAVDGASGADPWLRSMRVRARPRSRTRRVHAMSGSAPAPRPIQTSHGPICQV